MHEVDTFSYNNIAADNKNLIDAQKKKNDEDQIKENMNKD